MVGGVESVVCFCMQLWRYQRVFGEVIGSDLIHSHREPRPKRTANQLKALYYGMTKKEAETPKAETTEAETLEAETTEPDDSSEMEEWELEIIMRFCEKVRQLREEKRRNVAMERMRRLR